MKKIGIACILFFGGILSAFADAPDLSTYFTGKTACFILFDMQANKVIATYGADRCAQRISPFSTFKIPLSLMAFDRELITQQTVFKWNHQDRSLDVWNQDQTPHLWLKNSVVWVSQMLTPQLGLATIKNYLAKFKYGNQDFSGDLGKNNGLKQAWLGSSLKISGDEQLAFLKDFATNAFSLSSDAIDNTKENMYVGDSPTGWKLYLKTGSGSVVEDTTQSQKRRVAWCIGFVEKAGEKYIVVLNFLDSHIADGLTPAGPEARKMVEAILTHMHPS
jgi:beta-lactamase class D